MTLPDDPRRTPGPAGDEPTTPQIDTSPGLHTDEATSPAHAVPAADLPTDTGVPEAVSTAAVDHRPDTPASEVPASEVPALETPASEVAASEVAAPEVAAPDGAGRPASPDPRVGDTVAGTNVDQPAPNDPYVDTSLSLEDDELAESVASPDSPPSPDSDASDQAVSDAARPDVVSADPDAADPASADLAAADPDSLEATTPYPDAADLTSPDQASPDQTALGLASPDLPSPAPVRPDPAGPDLAATKVSDLEGAGPEGAGPEAAGPEAAGPDAASPDATNPDATNPEAGAAALEGPALAEPAPAGPTPDLAAGPPASPGPAGSEATAAELISAAPDPASADPAGPDGVQAGGRRVDAAADPHDSGMPADGAPGPDGRDAIPAGADDLVGEARARDAIGPGDPDDTAGRHVDSALGLDSAEAVPGRSLNGAGPDHGRPDLAGSWHLGSPAGEGLPVTQALNGHIDTSAAPEDAPPDHTQAGSAAAAGPDVVASSPDDTPGIEALNGHIDMSGGTGVAAGQAAEEPSAQVDASTDPQPGDGAGEPATEGEEVAASAPAQPDPDLLADPARLRSALEAVLLVVDTPTSPMLLAQVLDRPMAEVEQALRELRDEYDAAGRGLDLREVAGGWRLYTRAEFAVHVERFVLEGQQTRLTQAALETLAVIAYRQPITRSRVSAIRGVNVDGVMRTLLTRGLVEECGSDADTGGGLYRTTQLFLERLGISSLEELPSLAPLLPDTSQLDDVALST